NVHSSSSMIGLAISSVSVVPMPEVNSSPRKLTAPPGLFETVSKSIRFHLSTVYILFKPSTSMDSCFVRGHYIMD
ncbi:hypothetical protein, partial [Burkholderia multivorans]|uniref:hypothetical protein n=1 Tax=Burkholderia multivorans TaxID=87883 RepID=UPI001C2546B2